MNGYIVVTGEVKPIVVTDEEIAEHVFAGGVRVCNR